MDAPEPPDDAPIDPHHFVRFGVLFYGAMAIVAVLWREGLQQGSIWVDDGRVAPDWPRDVGAGLAFGAAVVVASSWVTRRTGWGERLARALAAGLGALSVPDALLLACASGLAEEMFFRGALQPQVGLFWASLLFGLVHFGPTRDLLPWTAFAILTGFALGGLFAWTGNLVAPVVAHTLINAVNLPLLVREFGPGATDGADEAEGPS